MRLGFFLAEAFGSMRRNWVMAMAAVITVFISTAILGAVLVTRDNLNQGATSLKNRVMIEVFIRDDATRRGEGGPGAEDPVDPRDQELRVHHQGGGAASGSASGSASASSQNLPINPLPASWEIQVKDANQVDAVAAKFFDDPAVDNDPGTHNGVKYARETVRKMLGTINLIGIGMWIATGIFALAAVLLISTTVRLSIFARRREVEIMRLVGATNWFIRWPFVLEGFITGLIGAVVAAGFVWLCNWALANWLESSDINFLNIRVFSMWWQSGSWPAGLLPTLAVLGAVLGALGSMVALRRYLKT